MASVATFETAIAAPHPDRREARIAWLLALPAITLLFLFILLPTAAVIKSGDAAQKRALAAAGRADERNELAGFRLQADALQDGVTAIGLGDAIQRKHTHCAASTRTFFLAASG